MKKITNSTIEAGYTYQNTNNKILSCEILQTVDKESFDYVYTLTLEVITSFIKSSLIEQHVNKPLLYTSKKPIEIIRSYIDESSAKKACESLNNLYNIDEISSIINDPKKITMFLGQIYNQFGSINLTCSIDSDIDLELSAVLITIKKYEYIKNKLYPD